jgi:biopolymer transport protein TolR
MRKHKRQRRKMMAEINVVPYIDVMLVLLIIFMVTAPLMSQGVKVDLPKAAAKTLPPEQKTPIIVTVDQQGEYFLNITDTPKVALSSDQLEQKVSDALHQDDQRKVYVRGDKQVSYGTIVQAMVLLQKSGAPTVGLITEADDVAQKH